MSFIINHFLVSSIPHLFRKIKIFTKMRNKTHKTNKNIDYSLRILNVFSKASGRVKVTCFLRI